MKTCTKCCEDKPIGEFSFRKDTGKHRNWCKQCVSARQSVYYQVNKDRIMKTQTQWRNNNPEKSKAIYARYRDTDKRRKIAREWAKRNRKNGMERFVERYASDIQFNLAIKFRRRIYMAVRKQFTIKAKKTIDLLGTTYPKFKEYIERKFTEGMSWEKVLSGEIHLDHIHPVSVFDLRNEAQQKLCFHYSNLQPLWAIDNLKKRARIDLTADQIRERMMI